jgi:competence protein ComEC
VKRRSFEESDLIRLRLQRLERLSSPEPLMQRIFAGAPVLPFAVCFMAGIWFISNRTSACVWGMGIAGIISAMLLIISFRTAGEKQLRLTLAAACLVFFVAGAASYAVRLYIGPDHIRNCLHSDRQLATLKGTVLSPVSSSGPNTSIPWLDEKSSFYMETRSILSEGRWVPVRGTVRIQVSERLRDIRPGNEVLIYSWLSPFHPPSNPGQFDLKRYMARKGVYVAASVSMADGVEVLDQRISPVYFLRSLLYRFCEDALLDDNLPDSDVRAMAGALLLGRRGGLEPAVMNAFQKTNLAHFISLSGQHVAILAGSLWLVFRTLGCGKRLRALLCILLIVTYALIVPPAPATNRAVFLACFVFASFLIGRQSKPLNTLALSAMVLLTLRPYELFSSGWQLSFLSVFGILIFYQPVVFFLRCFIFYPVALALKNRLLFLQHIFYGVLDITAVGISAWAAIAGLLAYYFGQINPLSPVWTVLMMPFMLILLYAGYLKLVIAKLLPTLSALLSVVIHYASNGFEKGVVLLSKVDFCQLRFSPPPAQTAVLIYAIILTLLFLPFVYRRTRLALSICCVCLFCQPLMFNGMSRFANRPLEITCLSVGHGQAIVLSGPGGERMLFDAGSITSQDIAQRTLMPFFRMKGIHALDALYISHGDLDHINAVADTASFTRIRSVYANAEFIRTARQPSIEQQVCAELAALGLDPVAVTEYSQNGLRIRSLWPTAESLAEAGIRENDRSEVLLMEYAGRRVLLCGDIELYAQQRILSLYPTLRADVMVLPHHGSTVNLDERFIERLDPQTVIASCAVSRVKNAWRPSQSSARKAFYTGRDGAVTTKIKADGTISTAGFLTSSE